MLSGLIPGLNSVNWPEDEVSDQFQASLINLLDLPNQFLSSFVEAYPAGTNVSLFTHSQRQHWSELGLVLEWRTLALCVYVGILVPMALLAWLHYEEGKYGGDSVAPLAEESPETNAEAVISDSMHLLSDAVFSFSALFKATGAGESVPESDVNHADDLQVQEPMSNGEPSSSSSSSQSCFCRICLENKQTIQMYRNQICSHSFCHDCTSKHIAAKIQENIKTVLCPGEDCTAALDFDACRQIIPKEVIVQWDEFLCKSMITKSQIIYCPFRDCSAMLVNDSGEIIEETNCPACKRSICARCHVPWHVEFTCKEFMRLGGKKRGKENMLVEELAKKKSWRKCPECEIYVEKTEGCSHITCRCGHEFCYRCGLKWVKFHSGCNLAQGQGFNSQLPPHPHSMNWDLFL
ncbi:probable E3 ubiquitin-protein ligase ARI3 isoform X1 [Camellia sinensis]|uniref:probable E3 ubiquitin-protein ligase ARI3 isoform X1 n=1 Tax=Camellia sinensis TaxID=4442 RepID=UPI001036B4A3|nr:probable E3 ubiquitin-protein ligase ARI3 isoform X1 [Camellia sinensis]